MQNWIRRSIGAGLFALLALLVGCAGLAPNYSPSINNVELIKATGQSMHIDKVTVTVGMSGANSIALRANSMISPVGENFGDYIAAAVRSELALAKLHDPKSPIVISGVLLKNNINAGGISTNDGEIEVRFVVKRGNQIRFDKVKMSSHQWPSSFVGAIAIPAAAEAYPVLVQKLIAQLFTDPDFVKAIKG